MNNLSGDVHVDKVVAKSKIVLLSLSLASLVKSEEGFISDFTFAGLLDGKVDLTKNDPYNTASTKRALVAAIYEQLAVLDTGERGEVLYRLGEFMATNPSVEDLYDQQKILGDVKPVAIDKYRETPA